MHKRDETKKTKVWQSAWSQALISSVSKPTVGRVTRWLASAVLIGGLIGLAGTSLVQAKSPLNGSAASSSLPTVELRQLPAQAQDVMGLITTGGPFKYDKDGTVFGNRERILPSEKRGFYREYTVKTPGEKSRGARRIVCGGLQPTSPDACFYTDDHYSSFRKIAK